MNAEQQHMYLEAVFSELGGIDKVCGALEKIDSWLASNEVPRALLVLVLAGQILEDREAPDVESIEKAAVCMQLFVAAVNHLACFLKTDSPGSPLTH